MRVKFLEPKELPGVIWTSHGTNVIPIVNHIDSEKKTGDNR